MPSARAAFGGSQSLPWLPRRVVWQMQAMYPDGMEPTTDMRNMTVVLKHGRRSILADKPCVTRHGQSGERPAKPGGDPLDTEVSRTPGGVAVRSPVLRLPQVDDRHHDIDRVPGRVETRVGRRAVLCRSNGKARG